MAQRLVIRIDFAAPAPAYKQIASAIRTLLVSGALSPDAQLPTVRQLAIDLGVHHNTVAEAYRLLADEGWLEMRRRLGVRVLDRSQPRASAATRTSFLRRLRELSAEARSAGLSAAAIAAAMRSLADHLSPADGTPRE